MCGRYYVDDETAKEIEKIVRSVDEQLKKESAMDKKMFCEAVEHRRLVIPAAGFYEWNRQKEKSTFTRKDSPVLYMAGT